MNSKEEFINWIFTELKNPETVTQFELCEAWKDHKTKELQTEVERYWKASDLIEEQYDELTEKYQQLKQENKELLIEFLDDLRNYIHESKNDLINDERTSEEIVNIFLLTKTNKD